MNHPVSIYILLSTFLLIYPMQTNSLTPYATRNNLLDMLLPTEVDPFRILEHSPITIPKHAESVALARVDWKETSKSHVIMIDIPGMRKEEVSIEVEENRVLRVSGERKVKEEEEEESEVIWHRNERISGRFWRRFRLPGNSDLDKIQAKLEDGVLRITVPKLAEEKKREAKVISIQGGGSFGEDIKPQKADI